MLFHFSLAGFDGKQTNINKLLVLLFNKATSKGSNFSTLCCIKKKYTIQPAKGAVSLNLQIINIWPRRLRHYSLIRKILCIYGKPSLYVFIYSCIYIYTVLKRILILAVFVVYLSKYVLVVCISDDKHDILLS